MNSQYAILERDVEFRTRLGVATCPTSEIEKVFTAIQ